MKKYNALHKNSQSWGLPKLNEAANSLVDAFKAINDGLERIDRKAQKALAVMAETRRMCR